MAGMIARRCPKRMQEALTGLAGDPEIVDDGEAGKHALDLQGPLHSEAAYLVRLEAGDVAALEEHAAAVGGQQARYQIEESGLASTIRPDDGMQAPAGEAEAQIVHGGQAAEPLGQRF